MNVVARLATFLKRVPGPGRTNTYQGHQKKAVDRSQLEALSYTAAGEKLSRPHAASPVGSHPQGEGPTPIRPLLAAEVRNITALSPGWEEVLKSMATERQETGFASRDRLFFEEGKTNQTAHC